MRPPSRAPLGPSSRRRTLCAAAAHRHAIGTGLGCPARAIVVAGAVEATEEALAAASTVTGAVRADTLTMSPLLALDMAGTGNAIEIAGAPLTATGAVCTVRHTVPTVHAGDVTRRCDAGEGALATGTALAVTVGALPHAARIVGQAGHLAGRRPTRDRTIFPLVAVATITVAMTRRVVVLAPAE